MSKFNISRTNELLAKLGMNDSIRNEYLKNSSNPLDYMLAFKKNNSEGYTDEYGYTYRAVNVIGQKENVYLNNESQACELLTGGEYLYEFASGVQETLLLTSSSAADSFSLDTNAKQVMIVGFDINGGQVFDVVNLNGQTPVSTAQQFHFVITMVVVTSAAANQAKNARTNLGDIYLCQNAETYTAGVPNNRALICATIRATIGGAFLAQWFVPPGQQLFFDQLVLSAGIDASQNIVLSVNFWVKQGASGYRRLAKLNVGSATPSINLNQDAFPSISFGPSPAETYFFLSVDRLTGQAGANEQKFTCYLTGVQIQAPGP